MFNIYFIKNLKTCWLCYLEVVWQLWAAGIARVHGDTDVALGVEGQLRPFKHKHVHVGLHGADDAKDLLGDHRQHLQVDSVELIKTCPCSCRGQTLEELKHKHNTFQAWHREQTICEKLIQQNIFNISTPLWETFHFSIYLIPYLRTSENLKTLIPSAVTSADCSPCPWRCSRGHQSSWRRHTGQPVPWRDPSLSLSCLCRRDLPAHRSGSGGMPPPGYGNTCNMTDSHHPSLCHPDNQTTIMGCKKVQVKTATKTFLTKLLKRCRPLQPYFGERAKTVDMHRKSQYSFTVSLPLSNTTIIFLWVWYLHNKMSAHLSVSGVMTRRVVLPRYSYEYLTVALVMRTFMFSSSQ